MPLALVTGTARENSIGAAICRRLGEDGWDVATSDLSGTDFDCDLASPDGPDSLLAAVAENRGRIDALVLSHAHDVETGILDTTEVVAFLLSPAGRWISGQLLHADGGFSARF